MNFEEYWRILAGVEPNLIETAVNNMAKSPTRRVAWFIEIFRREQFLRSYQNDALLAHRLNQVLQRVKLTPVPTEAIEVVTDGRLLVHRRLLDLLPPQKFKLP